MKQHSMATKPKVPPPQKPVNAFFHFHMDKLSQFFQANPGKKLFEITKLMSEAYKNLSITERKKYENAATADKERYKKEYQKYMGECKIPAPKRIKSLPTTTDYDNDDEEYKENPPKKMKGEMVKDTQKYTSDKENNMIFEDAAGSKPGPNPNNPHIRRNSLNQICFVQTDELSGKEILVPGMYLLNKMVNGIPESKLTPEIWQKIEAARLKDKENLENAKREVGEK